MAGAARDMLDRLVGEAGAVRDAFEQLPVVLLAVAGPDHRITAMNAACRAFAGRSRAIGARFADVFGGPAGRRLGEVLDRVYASGQAETRRERRTAAHPGRDGPRDADADFTVVPQRGPDGAVTGLLVAVLPSPAREAARARKSSPPGRAVVAELQEALLPTALPVLPRATIAARYLVAGHEQAAGGDWFDAIPLAGGRVALVVGDVVGHGVAASAAMGQARAVLAELLIAQHDPEQVLQRIDALAARTPALRAATVVLAVLDPVDGSLVYSACGHPPPLVIGTNGATRFLPGTQAGPLGTSSLPVMAAEVLRPDELVLLYSDGLIERPRRTISEGMAELARVAADAAATRALQAGAPRAAADRVCQLTVERLTRAGYYDDVTALAAQRLAVPVPELHLELPGERPSLTIAREAFTDWLGRLGAAAEDREGLHLAMVEIFTNAIEHAYPAGVRGSVELDAILDDTGQVSCRIADHGRWRPPDPAQAGHGHGLMVAGQVVDTIVVSRAPQPGDDARDGAAPAAGGTVVKLLHRLHRPAVVASDQASAAAAVSRARGPEPAFSVDTSVDDGNARAKVRGPVDITTADQLTRRLLSACRGGTLSLIVDLTKLTQLASAGVRALFRIRELLAAHQQHLTLITAPGSSAHAVLDLVHLPHVAQPDLA